LVSCRFPAERVQKRSTETEKVAVSVGVSVKEKPPLKGGKGAVPLMWRRVDRSASSQALRLVAGIRSAPFRAARRFQCSRQRSSQKFLRASLIGTLMMRRWQSSHRILGTGPSYVLSRGHCTAPISSSRSYTHSVIFTAASLGVVLRVCMTDCTIQLVG
jgi:hypothetical protein